MSLNKDLGKKSVEKRLPYLPFQIEKKDELLQILNEV
jgi:hypothetical protein